MVRTWNKNGHPTWVEPMTEEELDEIDLWAMNGIKPWASVPPGTDTTNGIRSDGSNRFRLARA